MASPSRSSNPLSSVWLDSIYRDVFVLFSVSRFEVVGQCD